MADFGFGIKQEQRLSQVQVMSQRQIQSLEILSLGSDELREKIYSEAERNPALEIVNDTQAKEEIQREHKADSFSDYEHYSPTSASASEASDKFQAIIESAADERETLQDHFLSELNLLDLPDEKTREYCTLIIGNLDSKGHHILSPSSLSKDFASEEGQKLLDKCLSIVQNLEPIGCAVKDVWESLLVQAKIKGGYNHALSFLLDGHADVVFGSRFLGGGAHRVVYYWHYLGNKFLTTLSNMTTNLNLTDMEVCYKVFKREVIREIAPTLKEERFGFEVEITSKVAKRHVRVYEVPISYYGRAYAEGKKIGWRDGFRALWCILKYRFCD